MLESHHRAAEVLYYLAHSRAKSSRVTAFPSDRLFGLLVQARRNLGLFQHHDGITGTAKDHVVVDYGVRYVLEGSYWLCTRKDNFQFPSNKSCDPF